LKNLLNKEINLNSGVGCCANTSVQKQRHSERSAFFA